MYTDRCALYKNLEEKRQSKVLAYITGTRPNRETQIHPEVLDFFADHLDNVGPCKKISLILHTNGGVTLAGWAIVNLIRMFCDEFEVIIPFKSLSTGTLIAIGADNIIMTKQATLGPIDPSTNSPYNPQFPADGSGQTLPVSVEHLAGFFEMAKEHINSEAGMISAFMKLCDKVHPLAAGNVHRTRKQIQMLASRLLRNHMEDEDKIKKIIDFLCSESGSHDYTMNRREAGGVLGLPVEKPDDELYSIIKNIYKDFSSEMKFTSTYTAMAELAGLPEICYEHCRGAIESITGGTHRFISKGKITKKMVTQPVGGVQQEVEGVLDQLIEEAWYHDE